MDTKVRAEILRLAVKNRQVVYGQQSTNFNLPSHLRRETKDFDILTNKPEKSAKELVESLNKQFGKDKYKVEPAIHTGTFKVKNSDGKIVADYTGTTKKPKSFNEVGVRYANIAYSEKKLKKLLKDEAYQFRHDKDFEMLRRIRSRND